MADDNKIVSPFRDLCLEKAVRFVNHQNNCNFNKSIAEEILQDGRLFMITVVIVVQYIQFIVVTCG